MFKRIEVVYSDHECEYIHNAEDLTLEYALKLKKKLSYGRNPVIKVLLMDDGEVLKEFNV